MTQETMTTAPEIKAAPDDVNAAFDTFMEGFEAFKETNDRRLAEMEKKQVADALTIEKLGRIDKAMDEQKKLLDRLALKGARPPLGRPGASAADALEHKTAFEAISAAATRRTCARSRRRPWRSARALMAAIR